MPPAMAAKLEEAKKQAAGLKLDANDMALLPKVLSHNRSCNVCVQHPILYPSLTHFAPPFVRELSRSSK